MTRRVVLLGASLAARCGGVSLAMNRRNSPAVLTAGVVGAQLERWIAAAPIARSGDIAVVIEAGGNGVASATAVLTADRKLRSLGYLEVVWVVFDTWPQGPVAIARAAARAQIVAAGVRRVGVLVTASDLARDRKHLNSSGGKSVMDQLSSAVASVEEALGRPFDGSAVAAGGGSSYFERASAGSTARLRQFWPLMQSAGAASGVDPRIIAAITWVESKWTAEITARTTVRNRDGSSSVVRGGRGIAQFIPSTGRQFGLLTEADLMNPSKAIPACARYLAQLRQTTGSWDLAIEAYNAGWGNVRARLGRASYDALSRQSGRDPSWHREKAEVAHSRYMPSVARIIVQVNSLLHGG